MKKKLLFLIAFLFVSISCIYADIEVEREVGPLKKGDIIYESSYKVRFYDKEDYYIGTIKIKSTGDIKYTYEVPLFAMELDPSLEGDVQFIPMLVTDFAFKNDEIITIKAGGIHVFEFNINTYEVKCTSDKSRIFKYDVKTSNGICNPKGRDAKVKQLFESDLKEIIEKGTRLKYTRTQPEKKKLVKVEDVIAVAETALFSIYGEANIKKQMPYKISRYKNKWYIHGTLPEGWCGGVFEIVINGETSQIESYIHGK